MPEVVEDDVQNTWPAGQTYLIIFKDGSRQEVVIEITQFLGVGGYKFVVRPTEAIDMIWEVPAKYLFTMDGEPVVAN